MPGAADSAGTRLGDAMTRLLHSSRDGQLVVDESGAVVAANDVARLLLAEDGAIDGRPLGALLARERDGVAATATGLIEQGPGATYRPVAAGSGLVTCDVLPDVEPGLALVTLRPAAGDDGTERARALAAIADSSHDALCALDRDGVVRVVNARAEVTLGYSARALRGKRFSSLIVEDRRPEFEGALRSALTGKDVFQHDTLWRARDGTLIDVTINLAPLAVAGSADVPGVSAIVQDISARKRLERELRDQAERDALTGLFNRRRFDLELYRLARFIGRHPDQPGAVLLVDVDDFKTVNDAMGHPAGDALLRAVGDALQGHVRDSDIAARIGGDEFAVLAWNVDAPATHAIAAKLASALREALAPWQATASVGGAHATATDSPETMLGKADRALYAAKIDGTGVHVPPA